MRAMIGPFECIPFKTPVAISPLSSRPKKDTSDRRVIMDYSWPLGTSLNDGISKLHYMGKAVALKYPTVDKLARRVFELMNAHSKQAIYFYKEDLDRAFRQLLGCPKSVPLLDSEGEISTTLI